MRITKTIAQKAAREMTAPHRAEVTRLRNLLSDKVSEIYLKTVPEIIIKANETHSGYIERTKAINLTGFALNHERVELNKYVPSKNGWSETLLIEDKEVAQELAKMIEELNKADNHADRKENEIEAVLLALKTFKNISEQFPEAIEFIDNAPQVRNLPVNLKELRQEFQSK